jgi:hypothetical protein
MGVGVDDDVKQKRFARPQGFLDLWRELRRILDAQGVATASSRCRATSAGGRRHSDSHAAATTWCHVLIAGA